MLGGGTTFLVQTTLASRQRDAGVLEAKRREIGDFLAHAQATYAATMACYRDAWTGGGWSDECVERLSTISSAELITSLDRLRLLLGSDTLEEAVRLVGIIRHGGVVQGSIPRDAYRTWRTTYWSARRSLIAHARHELGVARAADPRRSLGDDPDAHR